MSDASITTAPIGLPEHQEAHRKIAALLEQAYDIAASLPHIDDCHGHPTCPIAMSACILQLATPEPGADGVDIMSGVLALGRGDQMADMVAKQLSQLPMGVARRAIAVSLDMREERAAERKAEQEGN